jgi:murein DD-endopeptidase MepM/ murein hydrolase activator NlpD
VWDYYKRTLRPAARLGNGNIRLIFPLAIPAPISSLFGWRTHPITGEQRFHSGTDLAAPLGTPVLAAYAGRVAIADFLGGYGLAVALEHNKATQQTLYAHLSEIFVKPGEWVKQGEAIGRVGSTGNSTGPHLHFEFRQLTPDGWVAMDAGQQLEYAMAQLVKAMQVATAKPSPSSRS